MTILYFIIGLSVLIFIHELGHFVAAKIFGVYVYEFSLFMGPKIFQFKIGETKYTLRCLPIGGYCSMAGEEDSQSKRNEEELEDELKDTESNPVEIVDEEEQLPQVPHERTLLGISNWKKIIIMAAGAVCNIILAFVLMIAYYSSSSISKVNVQENSIAYEAGLRNGDEIKQMYVYFYEGDTYDNNDTNELHLTVYKENIEVYYNIESVYEGGYEYLLERINEKYPSSTGYPSVLTQEFKFVTTDGETFTTTRTYTVNLEELKNKTYEPISSLGISSSNEKMSFGKSISYAFKTEVKMATAIYESLGKLFTKEGINNVAGPVGMYSIATTFMAEGFMYFMYFLAMISVNLGVMNLLPFPALDGGKIVLTVCEMITKKKVPAKAEGILNLIGFAILILLMVVVTFKDIFFPVV